MNKFGLDKSALRRLWYLFGAAILVGIDVALKKMAVDNLKGGGLQIFIDNILGFFYHENTGAAFGIFQGHTEILAIVTSVVLLFVACVIVLGKMEKPFANFSLMLVLAGGVGNLIDRVFRGFVVDYIYFLPFNFPVFNFADICVVMGTLLLIIYAFVSDIKKEKEKVGSKASADVENVSVSEK